MAARSLQSRKRMRQNAKRQLRNKTRKTVLKSQTRKMTDVLATGDKAASDKQFRALTKLLDQTAAKGTIHRKTAARRKSRLARRLNALKAGK